MTAEKFLTKKLFFAFLILFCIFSLVFVKSEIFHADDVISQIKSLKDVGLVQWFSGNATKIVNDTPTEDMYKKVRVFCWMMTSPSNRKKANAVKATWAKRCNGFVFVSTEEDQTLPAINAGVAEGRDYLWGKTKFGFRYAYNNFLDEYDWFMKADDDTFVIVENLRSLLSNYSANDPMYFGCQFKPYTPQGYMSGGAGYVLSREALRRFIEDGLNKNICRKDDHGDEDVEMGKCLEKVEVKAMDSRDSSGTGRFFPFEPAAHMEPGHNNVSWWYPEYLKYPEKDLLSCCSDTAISFHYINEIKMYVLEYLIYHLRIPYETRTAAPKDLK